MTPNIAALPIDGLLVSRPHQDDPHGFQSIYSWGHFGLSVIESPKWVRPGALLEIMVVEFGSRAELDADGVPPMFNAFYQVNTHLFKGETVGEWKTLDFFSTDAAAAFIAKAAAFFQGEVAA